MIPATAAAVRRYKKCCQPKEEAAEREVIAKDQATREERAAVHRLERRATKAEVLARFAAAAAVPDELEELPLPPTPRSPSSRLASSKRLEAAARDLLVRFPHVHDGWDRLGMVHEARGEKKQAADCYRKAIEIIRGQSENYNPEFADVFVKLVDKLTPTRCLTYPITTSRSARAPQPRPPSTVSKSTAIYPQIAGVGSRAWPTEIWALCIAVTFRIATGRSLGRR